MALLEYPGYLAGRSGFSKAVRTRNARYEPFDSTPPVVRAAYLAAGARLRMGSGRAGAADFPATFLPHTARIYGILELLVRQNSGRPGPVL